jgi:hypothetical protein
MGFIEDLQWLVPADAMFREALHQCAREIWFAEPRGRVEESAKILTGRVMKCLDPVEAMADGMDAWILGVVARNNGRGQKPLPPPSCGFSGLAPETAAGLAAAQAAYRTGLALRVDLLEMGDPELTEWMQRNLRKAPSKSKDKLRAKFGRFSDLIDDAVSEVVVKLYVALTNGMVVASWKELDAKLVAWATNWLKDEARRRRLVPLDEQVANRYGEAPRWDAELDLQKLIEMLDTARLRDALRRRLEGDKPCSIREDMQLSEAEWKRCRKAFAKLRDSLGGDDISGKEK